MPDTSIIDLKDVSYTYPGRNTPALVGLNWSFGNECIGLIGDNGSGKTTLAHLIMGMISPSQGELLFKGRPLSSAQDLRELRKAIGFVFQNADDQLFSPTVLEDVAFGPLNLGLSASEARARSLETLESLGLSGYENRLTHKLSGGEKRRVALATVLVMAPEALILDEPTNDLDPGTRESLIRTLKGLPQRKLIISHDWDFLHQVVDRLVVVQDGAIHGEDVSILHTHSHAHVGGGATHRHGDHE